ncbi:hypothetical protein FVF58_40385 [Paraburkholderia panacisoli]|uniref:Uncharacterized protein n=1 Tax=Paraburkholderia panacisoli TaxID=2603818 RepID=A0A5B0GAX4_9BURK|nr:hypothetical protein [Paraburkholderia panacisoli]KAA1000593.1 hypothetical protein FVF58_40385 [Paraburkholderia panacisoli]
MNRSRLTRLAASITLALAATSGTAAFAQTAKTTPQDSSAPMAKPPESASGSGGASNPDNMPIKRPRKPTNDRLMHAPPASGANAK